MTRSTFLLVESREQAVADARHEPARCLKMLAFAEERTLNLMSAHPTPAGVREASNWPGNLAKKTGPTAPCAAANRRGTIAPYREAYGTCRRRGGAEATRPVTNRNG